MKITKSTKIRDLLQFVGTELFRKQLNEEVWINSFFSDYKKQLTSKHTLVDPKEFGDNEEFLEGYPNWIITDCRFLNELRAVKDRGGITIRVERPSLKLGIESLHPSETSLDGAEFDYTLHNSGTIEELIEKVREVLIAEKIL